MSMKNHIEQLNKLGACEEAIDWAKGYKSAQTAWRYCKRGDWMLWVLGKVCDGDEMHKKVVLAACECARLSLTHVPDGEDKPRIAIETTEKWVRGEATIDDIRTAAYAVYLAYAAAYTAYITAVYPAYAAYAAYTTAHAAAYASAAAHATSYASATDAKEEALSKCADIVRKHFPKAPKVKE